MLKIFEEKKMVVYVVAALIVVAVAGALFLAQRAGRLALPEIQRPGEAPVSPTREEVPPGVEVPELGEEAAEGVAVPVHVAPASDFPLTDAQSRSFMIVAENNRFSPNQIIVRHMDVVTIDFSAVGRTYDITIPDYGLQRVAADGQTVRLQFQADQVGRFTFYCERCGGLQGGVTGTITVVPAEQR
jgi:heme/copper-type cytochrome/quinol oxidase subunit 2